MLICYSMIMRSIAAGWLLSASALVQIPIWAVYIIYKEKRGTTVFEVTAVQFETTNSANLFIDISSVSRAASFTRKAGALRMRKPGQPGSSSKKKRKIQWRFLYGWAILWFGCAGRWNVANRIVVLSIKKSALTPMKPILHPWLILLVWLLNLTHLIIDKRILPLSHHFHYIRYVVLVQN